MEYPVTLVRGREREAWMKKTRKAQTSAGAAHRLKAVAATGCTRRERVSC